MKKISLNDHENYLKKNIFFTENKWPHFELIFKDIKKFSKSIKTNSTIVSLERNNLYGGVSLFAPYFSKSDFISVDCSMPKIRKRGNYKKVENRSLIIEKKIIMYLILIKLNLKKILQI